MNQSIKYSSDSFLFMNLSINICNKKKKTPSRMRSFRRIFVVRRFRSCPFISIWQSIENFPDLVRGWQALFNCAPWFRGHLSRVLLLARGTSSLYLSMSRCQMFFVFDFALPVYFPTPEEISLCYVHVQLLFFFFLERGDVSYLSMQFGEWDVCLLWNDAICIKIWFFKIRDLIFSF